MITANLGPLASFAAILMAIAALLALYRLVRGPSVADRVVAADMLSITATAGLVIMAMAQKSAFLLDVALVFGALAFVGVVAIARAMERDN